MKKFLLALAALLALTGAAGAANRFLTCAVTCTITSSDTTIWGTTSGGTGASVPGVSDAVILDGATCVGGVTCTATLNFGGTWSIQSFAMGTCTASTTGCIFDNSVNNNNITMSLSSGNAMNISGTGTRTIRWGSATYTLSGTSASFISATITNLTMVNGTATIAYTGASGTRVFDGGWISYPSLSFGATSPATATGNYQINGFNTFKAISITPPNYVTFPTGGTNTITDALNWQGTAANSNQIYVGSSSLNSQATLNVAGGSVMQYTMLRDLLFTGTTPACTNCFDGLHNSNATITGPTSGGGPNVIGGN